MVLHCGHSFFAPCRNIFSILIISYLKKYIFGIKLYADTNQGAKPAFFTMDMPAMYRHKGFLI